MAQVTAVFVPENISCPLAATPRGRTNNPAAAILQVTVSPQCLLLSSLCLSPRTSAPWPSRLLSLALSCPPTRALCEKHPCWRYLGTWRENRTCNRVAAQKRDNRWEHFSCAQEANWKKQNMFSAGRVSA